MLTPHLRMQNKRYQDVPNLELHGCWERDGDDLCFAAKDLSSIQKKVFAFYFPRQDIFILRE